MGAVAGSASTTGYAETAPGRGPELRATAQQLRLLAARLESIPAPVVGVPAQPAETAPGPDPILMLARALYAGRTTRGTHLPGIALGEPSWDMLLALYVAARDGEDLLVSALYSASRSPTSTALRHLKRLRDKHYVEVEMHGSDSRKRLVRLAPTGQARIEGLLAAMLDSFMPIVAARAAAG